MHGLVHLYDSHFSSLLFTKISHKDDAGRRVAFGVEIFEWENWFGGK